MILAKRLGLFATLITSFVISQQSRAVDEAPSTAAAPNSASATQAVAEPAASEPFAFADFTWLNGNSRQTTFPLDTKIFTGQFSFDGNYVYDFNHPKDHTLVGSTNSGRTSEFQVEQLGVGGDFHYENVRGRLMTQFGLYSTMTPRNDASPSRGQFHLDDAYRYVSEAYAGYHWDYMHGINLDAGIFMSYIGLCSYYNYENWVYQMSYVSANTPWFFNGLRLQIFPTDKLKAELWLINGWQSYGMYNEQPGLGFEVLYRPTGDWSLVTNNYYGADTFNSPGRIRIHSDNSIQYKYLDTPASKLSKGAFSFTADLGCENGDGVSCTGAGHLPGQNFLGFMFYNRLWFDHDKYGVTLGGGAITNPGRYLVLVPATEGQNAYNSTYTGIGTSFQAWDASATFDYMPKQFITYRAEFTHRSSNVPYFAGPGGISSASGNGTAAAGFSPDLVKQENRINVALLVRL
jgi:hypothetical protein